MDEASGASKVPLSFWVVAALGLAWNAFACQAYWLTATHDAATFAQTPPEMVRALEHTPVWALGSWGLAVGAALTGSVLMMLRSKWAVRAFVASLAGLLVLTGYQVASDMPMSLLQVLAIWFIALFLWRFSSSEAAKGLLH